MLQQDKPDDFVLATGVTHTIRSLVEKTFATQVGGFPAYNRFI
jgi:GDP-D-mannose dehydratase